MTVVIRSATVIDVREIANVHVQTWRHAYRGLFPDELFDSINLEVRTAQWSDWLNQLPEQSTVFVAEKDASIAGFCWIGRSRDDDADDSIGEVYAIYVLPSAQGEGIGAMLITEGVRGLESAGFRSSSLWILEGNSAARGFYEHQG